MKATHTVLPWLAVIGLLALVGACQSGSIPSALPSTAATTAPEPSVSVTITSPAPSATPTTTRPTPSAIATPASIMATLKPAAPKLVPATLTRPGSNVPSGVTSRQVVLVDPRVQQPPSAPASAPARDTCSLWGRMPATSAVTG